MSIPLSIPLKIPPITDEQLNTAIRELATALGNKLTDEQIEEVSFSLALMVEIKFARKILGMPKSPITVDIDVE